MGAVLYPPRRQALRYRGGVLHGLSIDIVDGEFMVFGLAHSGCGKSTLLRMVAGLGSRFRRGEIAIGGRVSEQCAGAGRTATSAMVFQDYALYRPHDGIAQYGCFALRLRGNAAAESRGAHSVDFCASVLRSSKKEAPAGPRPPARTLRLANATREWPWGRGHRARTRPFFLFDTKPAARERLSQARVDVRPENHVVHHA